MDMILNTGGRTDTVQYFSEWLLNRFSEGYALVRNPLFPTKISRYELTPSKVDCVVFCSKNYEPILPNLHKITDRFNSYCHYTITAYGKDIEPGVPSIDQSIDTLYRLEKIVGKERIAWRYDPVLLTKKYTVQKHLITFEHMASRLSGHVDRCIFSFVELYKKLQFNMPELVLLTDDDMHALAKGMGDSAARHRLTLQSCGTNTDWSRYGIAPAGCATLDILGKANGVQFKELKHTGMRRGCHCIKMNDIGCYNSCPNGCRYCYANQNPQLARENYRSYDPASPLLLSSVQEGDTITQATQRSFIDTKQQQMELFD